MVFDSRVGKLSRRLLGLLNQPGHVFEEEVVHLLLVHVSQLETEGGVRTGGRENLFRHLGFGFRRKDRKQDEMKNFG